MKRQIEITNNGFRGTHQQSSQRFKQKKKIKWESFVENFCLKQLLF